MTQEGDLLETAEDMKAKIDSYRAAHFKASDHLREGHYVIGLLLIVVSALVSGSVLQSTEGNPSQTLTLVTGSLSILIVILTSIQTTFKLGERGEQHRSAADGFGTVSRKLTVFIHRSHANIEQAWDELVAISQEISNLESGSPGFFSRTYRQARKDAREELERELEEKRTGAMTSE